MRRVAFAIAGLVVLGAGPATAQYGYPPRPVMSVGGIPPEGVFQMVRQMGLEPVGPPVAPRGAAVSIEPIAPAPQDASPPSAAPPQPTKPATPEMTPVAPLN